MLHNLYSFQNVIKYNTDKLIIKNLFHQSILTGQYMTNMSLLTCRFPELLPIQQFFPIYWNLHYRFQEPWSSEPYPADLHVLGDSAEHIKLYIYFKGKWAAKGQLAQWLGNNELKRTATRQQWTWWPRNQGSIPVKE